MTEQDVFDMARKTCGKWPSFVSNPNLQAFAKLVTAKKAEECAELVEKMGIEGYGTLAIAAAIRKGEQA